MSTYEYPELFRYLWIPVALEDTENLDIGDSLPPYASEENKKLDAEAPRHQRRDRCATKSPMERHRPPDQAEASPSGVDRGSPEILQETCRLEILSRVSRSLLCEYAGTNRKRWSKSEDYD